MTSQMHSVSTALAATLVVGLFGASATAMLARRSMTAATVAAPLVTVLCVAAGVLTGARTMLFDEARLHALLSMIGATLPAALLVGVLIAVRVRAVDRALADQESHRRETAEAERARREVVAAVSHDLRTPLAGIRAMAEALEDKVATDPDDYVRRILKEIDRTTAMVDDLLALTSLHAGTSATVIDEVDLTDLLSDTLASVGPAARATGVQLHGQAPASPEPLTVRGDIRQLSRACLNLVVNAVQHSTTGGMVVISAQRVADQVELTVEDSCGGIAEADLPRVFTAGWRGTSARTPESGPFRSSGAGLGLAIVHAVAQAHGGDIGVANMSTTGCRFTLRLPAG
ncbi:sensor histidine kinase [Austwickia chelonae]|uniref:sensor histidine kinase n=1 Tax=Austwickia chelonae TaxID=100225 RepID=UPI000E282E26|nr:HAMP domain-containing sensor histidine kinase [Austwickia chelonae]